MIKANLHFNTIEMMSTSLVNLVLMESTILDMQILQIGDCHLILNSMK